MRKRTFSWLCGLAASLTLSLCGVFMLQTNQTSAEAVSGYQDAAGNALEMTYDKNGVSTQDVYQNGAEIKYYGMHDAANYYRCEDDYSAFTLGGGYVALGGELDVTKPIEFSFQVEESSIGGALGRFLICMYDSYGDLFTAGADGWNAAAYDTKMVAWGSLNSSMNPYKQITVGSGYASIDYTTTWARLTINIEESASASSVYLNGEFLASLNVSRSDFADGKAIFSLTAMDGGWMDAKVCVRNCDPVGMINGVQFKQVSFGNNVEKGLAVNKFVNGSAVDISNVEWFAFEYANISASRHTVRMNLNYAYWNQANSSKVVFTDHSFTVTSEDTLTTAYFWLPANACGWMFVPKAAFTTEVQSLTTINMLLNVYTAGENGTAVQFGRILTYTEAEISDYTAGTLIADLYSYTDEEIAARIATTNSSSTSVVDVYRVKAPEYQLTTVVDGVTTTKTVSKWTVPTAPVKDGAAFIGWKKGDAIVAANTSFTVTEDCTIEALFVEFDAIGVSVKTEGTQGLRFKNQVTAESVALLESLGITASYGTKLTHDTLGTLHIATKNWIDEANKLYAAVLTFDGVENVESYYDDVFTATAYVEIGGVKYYANATQKASIAYVAGLALKDTSVSYSETEMSYLQAIVDSENA